MSLSGIESVSNTLTGNDIQDLNLNSVTAVYGNFTNLSATSMSVLTMNTPGVINCGGLLATGTITGPLISASSINNTGNYNGQYLTLNNYDVNIGYLAGSGNTGNGALAIGYRSG